MTTSPNPTLDDQDPTAAGSDKKELRLDAEDAASVEIEKGTVSPRNKLNDLTAKEWLPETVSVWTQKGLGASHPHAQIEKQHPAPFSFTDVGRLIRFFTKAEGVVLDPFLGVGSTLKACALNDRQGIGIELNPRYAALSHERLRTEVDDPTSRANQTIFEGDARDIIPTLEEDSLDFVVTSPPYWNILHKEDHKARQERIDNGLDTRYSDDDERDLGNIADYDDFIGEVSDILGTCGRPLRSGKYMAVVVGDFRHGSRYHMFHADLAAELERRDFVLKGITILYQRHKRVFPYGYPAAYVPNLHHQYIIIARNEK